MSLSHKFASLCMTLSLSVALAAPALADSAADAYPKDTIKFVCTHGTGDTDFNTRMIARSLKDELGVNTIVATVTGGNASVPYTQYKDERPDGYTLIGTNTMALAADEASGIIDFGYDAFEPVAVFGVQSGEVCIVPADAACKTAEDLVKISRDNGEGIKMGVAVGGSSYIAAKIMMQELNAHFSLIDTGGDGTGRILSLVGGHVDVTIAPYALAKPYIEAGKVRALFSLRTHRLPDAPELPTAAEIGIPNLYIDSLYAILAPKGTDKAIVEKLNAAIVKIVSSDESYRKIVSAYNYQQPYALSVEDTIVRLQKQREHIMGYAQYLKD